MGGLLSGLAKGLSETIDKDVFESQSSKLGREISESTVYSANRLLDVTEQGKILKGYLASFHKDATELSGRLDAPRQELWKGIKKDPVLSKNLTRYHDMPIGDIHQELVQQGSPLVNHSLQILQQGGLDTSQKTIAELAVEHEKQATLLAQASSMGANLEHVAPLIAELLDSPDPRNKVLGQTYADILNGQFRDTEMMVGRGREGEMKGPMSRSKVSLNKTFAQVNKFRDIEGAPRIPRLDTRSIYEDRTLFEKGLDAAIRGPQAAMAVIPHAQMEWNLMFAAPVRSYVRALMGTNRAEALRIIGAQRLINFHDIDAITDDFNARTGKLAQWTKNTTVGKIVSVAYNMPGLHSLRRMQIRHAAAVGYEAAHDYAAKMMKGSRAAEQELIHMKIDPAEVRANGGLTEDHKQRAVYHFADDTMFLKGGSLNMPLRADAGFWSRSVNMYHFFVRNQTEFMARTFARAARNGDLGSIIRMFGVMGILAPATVPLFKGLHTFTRTGSLEKAEEPFKKLYAPESSEEWMKAYGEAVSEMWGLGMINFYINSALNNSFWKVPIGAKISTPITMVGDLIKGAEGKDMKAFERDVLESVPVIGKPLAHKLLPTKKEEGSKYSPHHRRFSFKRRKQQ